MTFAFEPIGFCVPRPDGAIDQRFARSFADAASYECSFVPLSFKKTCSYACFAFVFPFLVPWFGQAI